MLVVGPAAVTPPALSLFHDDGPAVIQDCSAQINRGIVFHQVGVDRITPSENMDQRCVDVTDLQGSNIGLRERRT